jgi:hypothetical protein
MPPDTNQKRRRRYYSEGDSEVGVTRSQLKRLSKAKKREYMLYWFHRNFEDPVEETPYESAEGGYLYIWGGPYDARDELGDEFAGIVPDELIEEVVKEIEKNGTVDWAPGADHPNHSSNQIDGEPQRDEDEPREPERDLDAIVASLEGGLLPRYGDQGDIQRRREVLARLKHLQEALAPLLPPHAGIGHNHPPPDDEISIASEMPPASLIAQIREASDVVQGELEKSQPDALKVAHATFRLKATLGWFAKKTNVAAESFAKEFGGAVGKAGGAALAAFGVYAVSQKYSPVGRFVIDVVRHAGEWLSHVTLPF